MDLVSVLQLRDSTRNLIHAFGRKPPKPWTQQADGFYLSPSGKKRLSPESYERHKARLKQRESRPAKPASAAKPAATKTTTQKTAATAAQYKPDDLSKAVAELKRREQIAASTKRIKGVESKVMPGLIEKSKAKVAEIEKSLRASGNLPPAASIGAVKPAPSPMQTITNEVEKAYAQDRAKFGAKSANVIRRVSQLFLGALGAGGGAAIGATMGIPFGPAGVATGAVAGGLLGARSLTGVPRELQSVQRARAGARYAARQVAPIAAGAAAGLPIAAAGLGAGAAINLVSGSPVLGAVPAILGASAAGNIARATAQEVNARMTTSRAGARKKMGVKSDQEGDAVDSELMATARRREGERDGDAWRKRFSRNSELPANNPLVAVIRDRLKQLLAQSGQQFPEPTDEQILAAIAKVSE
jgi:hypothetical protein